MLGDFIKAKEDARVDEFFREKLVSMDIDSLFDFLKRIEINYRGSLEEIDKTLFFEIIEKWITNKNRTEHDLLKLYGLPVKYEIFYIKCLTRFFLKKYGERK